jgi:ribosomal protein S18 acetylase RimI-like enzyme
MSVLTILVRAAEPADAAGLAVVHKAAWLEAYRGILPGRTLARMVEKRGPENFARAVGRGEGYLVLVVGKVLAGYASFGMSRHGDGRPCGEIYELYLLPAYQGLGFGTRLFTAARKRLADAGLARLIVWALADNERAATFYQRQGGVLGPLVADRYEDRFVNRRAFLWNNER